MLLNCQTFSEPTKGSLLFRITEDCFLLLLGVYLGDLTMKSAKFCFSLPSGAEKLLFFAMAGVVLVKYFILFLDGQRIPLIPGMLLLCLYVMIYRSDKYFFLLFNGLITAGTLGIDYRKPVKLIAAINGIIVFSAAFASLAGAIENLVYFKGFSIRSALGIGYPTDAASFFLYLVIFVWVVFPKLPDWCSMLLIAAVAALSHFYIGSDTTTLCCAAFLLLMMLEHLLTKNKGLPYFRRFFDLCLTFAFPIFASFTFVCIFLYSRKTTVGILLNRLFSSRLELAWDSFRENGLSLFGTPITQIGAGGTTFSHGGYNFVDSSYALILIRYGLVLFLFFTVSWCMMTRTALRNRDRRLAVILALIAFHSISEHHFTEPNYNLFALLPFASFRIPCACADNTEETPDDASVSESIAASRYRWLFPVCVFALSGLFLAVSPMLFTRLRTLVSLLLLDRTWNMTLYILIFLASCVFTLLVFTFVWSGAQLAASLAVFKKATVSTVVPAALSLFTLLCLIPLSESSFKNAETRYSFISSDERKALSLICGSASGTVHASQLPSLYQRQFSRISDSLLTGEDLARCRNTTVLMERGYDSKCFFGRGFLYTGISGNTSIYTNDPAVISALRDSGFHMTAYLRERNNLNLNYLSSVNRIPVYRDGSLSVTAEQPLKDGPSIDLYTGDYTLSLELSAETPGENTDKDLGVVRVTAYSGTVIRAEKQLKSSMLTPEGFLKDEIRFWTGDYQDIDFQLIPAENAVLKVSRLSYYRSPEYDIHRTYNRHGRVLREEYCSPSGEPVTNNSGYSACEYEYDQRGNAIVTSYYGADGLPVLLENGYAEVRKTFNVKKQVTEESYYGLDGSPVMCSYGYAAVRREYDDSGNAAVQWFLGSDGLPVTTTWGYAELHREYNTFHQIVRESYFDKEGKPAAMPAGHYGRTMEYDQYGNICLYHYLGADNTPVMRNDGFAALYHEFNDKRQIIKEEFYDLEGNLTDRSGGYAVIKRTYNKDGTEASAVYYDKNGRTVTPE